MRETPDDAARDAVRRHLAERAARHDEAMLRECGLDVLGGADPWAEGGDNLRPAMGVTLGLVLSAGAWTVVALVGMLVLRVVA
jgi:hypothetical protein